MNTAIFIILVMIATVITVGTEVFKKIYKDVCLYFNLKKVAEFPIGKTLALAFAFWGTISYGKGILFAIGMEYTNASLMYFGLIVTSLVVAGGSSKLYDIFKGYTEAKKKIQ